MSTVKMHDLHAYTVLQSITDHPAWYGHISGLKAEKMLRGLDQPYRYILRAGEFDQEYYVTFVGADLTIRHQPFVVTIKADGWYYENGCGVGPNGSKTIEHVLHAIMHCEEGACEPFINFQKR